MINRSTKLSTKDAFLIYKLSQAKNDTHNSWSIDWNRKSVWQETNCRSSIERLNSIQMQWLLKNDVRSLQSCFKKKICDQLKRKSNICLQQMYFISWINMQQYQKDYLKSRNKDQYDTIFCEIPDCWCVANDIHHITPSMKCRTHKKDWSDLIALCRKHHDRMHANNTKENVENCLAIVQKIITTRHTNIFKL
jgi:hypothetical protein